MIEFLHLLLPWSGQINWISDIFISSIVIYVIFSLVWFWLRTRHRRRLINGLIVEVGRYTRPVQPSVRQGLKEKFNCNNEFSEAWQEFDDSLITRQRNGDHEVIYKTDEASFFFSEDRILGQHMNLRYWNSVPALLVGLGILGTFVGLVWGLIPFSDITEFRTEEIQKAIKGLLPGVSTAFVTSVWGMLTSLMFNVLEKWHISKLNRAIANLQRALDRLFTLTTQEEIAFRQEDELAQQTQALKAFSTDLADKIKVAMGDIMSEKFDDMHQSLEQSNVQNVQESQEIIQALHKELENTNNVVETHLIPNLKNIDAVVEELQGQSKLMDRLDQNLTNFQTYSVQSKQEIVDKLQKLISSTEQIGISMETVCEGIVNLPKLLEQIADEIQTVLNHADDKFERRLAGMDEFFDRTAQNLENVQERTIMLLQLHDDRIEDLNIQLTNSQKILENGLEMFEQMDESVAGIRELIEATQALSIKLIGGVDQLETAGQRLTQASNMFNQENANYLRANRETTQQIQSTLEQSKLFLNDFVLNFETIEKSLNGIFEEIEKGLNTYADITSESINNYLEAFSEQLTNASNALAGSINALNENVVILNDIIDQLRDS